MSGAGVSLGDNPDWSVVRRTLLVGPAEALEEACGVLTGAFELEGAAALCMHEDG